MPDARGTSANVLPSGVTTLLQRSDTPTAIPGQAQIYAKEVAGVSGPILFHLNDNVTNDGSLGNGTIMNENSDDWEYVSSGAGSSGTGFGKAVGINTPAAASDKDNFLRFPNPSLGTGECTIEFWAKQAQFPTGNQYRALMANGTGHTSTDAFCVFVGNDSSQSAGSQTTVTLGNHGTAGTKFIAWTGLDIGSTTGDGPWRHFAFVRTNSGTDSTWDFYYNGSKQSTSGNTFTTADLDNTSGDWQFGALWSSGSLGGTYFMDGWFDELAIFDSAIYSGSSITVPSAPHGGGGGNTEVFVLNSDGVETQIS